MAQIDKNSLAYLGSEYQYRLIAQILSDKTFANSIIDIVSPNYFEDQYLRLIVAAIKDAKRIDDVIPDYGSLEFRLLEDIRDDIQRKFTISQLRRIKDANLNDTLKVQDIAMKFCKYQEMKKAVVELTKIINQGNFEDVDLIETTIRKALEHGDAKDDGMNVFDNIASVLVDDFRKPIRTGIDGLDTVMDGGLSKGELAVILAPFGVGKALGNSNKIYTPNGYKLMGEINVNDFVIGTDGNPKKVLGVYPQGEKDMYKISFNDGTSTFCCDEHLWVVNSMNQRNRKTKRNGKNVRLPKDESFKVLPTKEIMKKLKVSGNRFLNYKIPLIKPVNFIEKETSIHPYVLGVLLGDGNMSSSRVTTKDNELINELSKFAEISTVERCREFDVDDVLVLKCLESVTILGLADKLKNLGLRNTLSNNKFIPKEYLYNSIDNRVALLQGLMDTDGYASKSGITQFTTVSKQLGLDVRELVLSLGGFCGIKSKIPTYKYKGVKKNGKECYTLTISFPEDLNIEMFRLDRKLERVKNRQKYSTNKFIKSIEFSHKEEATCIMVDSEDKLFATDDFILTHNTTMVTKFANTAMKDGYNVLQIFFEDNPKVIQRKHLSCWSGYDLNSLSLHSDEIMDMANAMVKDSKNGTLRLKKFSSDGTTIPVIRQYIRKLIAGGFKPDLVLLDYIDCVEPSRKFDDVNAGEGSVMRQFEAMLAELDMAGWTAIQGNRSSIKSEVVEADQMGGSIKKAQIAHFVLSVAKTLDQKENNTATMAILKSRFGKSGEVFENIRFDNASIQIDMGTNKGPISQIEIKENKQADKNARVANLLNASNARKALLGGVKIIEQ